MKKELLSQFLSETYTIEQIRSRIFLLRSYVNKTVFRSSKTIDVSKQDQQWFDALPEDFKKTLSKKNGDQILAELAQETQQLKPLVLMLPFDLPEEEISKLGTWLRKNFNTSLVFEVKYDPGLIGGCSLIWNGVYHDYSVKHRIQQQQKQLLSTFRQYLK